MNKQTELGATEFKIVFNFFLPKKKSMEGVLIHFFHTAFSVITILSVSLSEWIKVNRNWWLEVNILKFKNNIVFFPSSPHFENV